MPLNINASTTTITVRTRRALRHSVGWKASTESLMASMPVRAAQPELNALISRTGVRAAPSSMGGIPCSRAISRFVSAASSTGRSPWARRNSLPMTRANTTTMNR